MNLSVAVNYNGNCREALEFYAQHLGGKLGSIMTFDKMPGGSSVPADSMKRIMHAEMQFGDAVLMANDVPSNRPWEPMRSAYLSLDLDSAEVAEAAYAALSQGAEVFMPMGETFFAKRFAMLRDKFGTNWMLLARAGAR